MGNAGDKTWKMILKKIQELDEDENFDDNDKIKRCLESIKVQADVAGDLQDVLYDQLTLHTKDELLADVQIAGPELSFESYRRACAQGLRKTPENVHRARSRVTRPDMAENLQQLEDKYKRREGHFIFEGHRRARDDR